MEGILLHLTHLRENFANSEDVLSAMVAFADEAKMLGKEIKEDDFDEISMFENSLRRPWYGKPLDMDAFVYAMNHHLEHSTVRHTALEIVGRVCRTDLANGVFRDLFFRAGLCRVLARVLRMPTSALEVYSFVFPAIKALVRKSGTNLILCTEHGLQKLIVNTMRRHVEVRAVQDAALAMIYNFMYEPGEPWHEARLFHAFLAAEREHTGFMNEVVSQLGTYGPKLTPIDGCRPRNPEDLKLALTRLQLVVEGHWHDDGARRKKLISTLCQTADATGKGLHESLLLSKAFAFNSGIWITLQLPIVARAAVLTCLGGCDLGIESVTNTFKGTITSEAQSSLHGTSRQ